MRTPGLLAVILLAACHGDHSRPAPTMPTSSAPLVATALADKPAPPAARADRVIALAADSEHACALLGDHSVKCWGWSGDGNGKGGEAGKYDGPLAPMGAALPRIDLGPGRTALSIGVGAHHACAVLDDHTIKCWGANFGGQLGLGDGQSRGLKAGEMGAALPTVDLGPGRTALAVHAAGIHTCAILDDHSIKCWGYNSGILGLGYLESHGEAPGSMGAALPAIDLGPGRTALDLATGSGHTCAILDDHTVKCWGNNSEGELGLGDKRQRGSKPGEMGAALPTVDLGPGRTAAALAVNYQHSCALLDDASVKCWGWNDRGHLGLGDTKSRGDRPGTMGSALPTVDLGPGRTALSIAAGFRHTCAVLDDHTLKCWGWNGYGQIGFTGHDGAGHQPGQMGSALPIVDLGHGNAARAVAAGVDHTCALLDDGRVKCWGMNLSGQLGIGDRVNRGEKPGEMGDALPFVALW
jgi:alpha-tubulin suppressor-like RCC1 family protein